MEENINNAIKEAIENAPERKFVESMDIQVAIKDVDSKHPSNRIKEEVRLPSGRGRDVRIAMFAAGEAATRARDAGIHVITPPEIEELGGNKGRAKKIGNQFDFFLSEVPHMGLIGRYLGTVLGPRGKMPRPVPPTLDPAVIATGLKTTVVVKSGDKMTFHTTIGTVGQSQEELFANAMEVYNRVIGRLERGAGNIRSLFIKTTMGPATRVEVEL